MSVIEKHRLSLSPARRRVADTIKVANRLTSTKSPAGWSRSTGTSCSPPASAARRSSGTTARALNPFFQAAGLEWCHGEAFERGWRRMHLEGPAQLAGEEYGYVGELCSYARTTLGCAVLTQQGSRRTSRTPASSACRNRRLWPAACPPPDMFVNAYAGCSTGQQWDEITSRVFGKQVPDLQRLAARSCGATSRMPAISAARNGKKRPATLRASCTS